MRRFIFTTCLLFSSGCATTSFAPPQVNRYNAMTSASLGSNCAHTGKVGAPIGENVAGARALIRNHLATYDCAMRSAADGRQWFEVPGFLSLIGATTAVAFGAGPNVAIAGATGNSVFTAGNKYYAPQEQTTILRSAVDAISCIQSEASGISAFEVAEAADQERTMLASGRPVGPSITVEQQYFDLIESRLTAVNSAAALRLAQRGTFDAAGIAAEIEKAADDQRKAEEAKEDGAPPAGFAALSQGSRAAAFAMSEKVHLDIDVLRPKLDKCVTRAKA